MDKGNECGGAALHVCCTFVCACTCSVMWFVCVYEHVLRCVS